ncbi:hypothetical protein MK632_13710 [Rhizobium changzhiense]|uniref:hypothetical protein n=1 Tax=Rhizobium changzhiense TaxID=2692317 RepID=UPI001F0CA957|nr:hypothetical protein [Rhizobium changzhiense]MCH4546831.1 hypothetical protein [Rhizobium changzhiense]
MPRSGAGIYTKPPNTTAQPNTIIKSAVFNSVIDDLVTDANNARPITAGGTGANTVEGARTGLGLEKRTTYAVKSADYAVVAADNNALHRFTAAVTLSLTSAATLGANWHYNVVADGGDLVIDPSDSDTIGGASSITIHTGQRAFLICDGTGFRMTVEGNPYVAQSGNYTANPGDQGTFQRFTAAATLSLPPKAILTNGWSLTVIAAGGNVTVDPNASETIDGAATAVIQSGLSVLVYYDGTAFFTSVVSSGLVKVGEAVVSSAVAAIDFPNVLSSAFDLYMIELDGVVGSASSPLIMQLSTDGGTNWLATGYDYSAVVSTTTNPASTQLSNQSAWGLGTSQVGTAGGGVSGIVWLHRLAAARRYEATLSYIDGTGTDFRAFNVAGRINQTADSVRVRFSSGNIAAGAVIRIYGVRK